MPDTPLGPNCTPECAEFATGDGLCPGWTHGDIHPTFNFENVPPPPCRYLYRVKVRRGERWFDVGAYPSLPLANKIAERWGAPGNAMVASEPQL